MQQWEYLSGTCEDDGEACSLGRDGWELVSVAVVNSEAIYYFKRQLRQYSTGKDIPAVVEESPATREDLISGGGTEREKELFQMGYEWGLRNARMTLREKEEQEMRGETPNG